MLGLVESGEKREVTYPDGEKSLAWVGVRFADLRTPWSSRNPCIVGSIPRDSLRSLLDPKHRAAIASSLPIIANWLCEPEDFKIRPTQKADREAWNFIARLENGELA